MAGEYKDNEELTTIGKRIRYIEPNYTNSIPMQGPRGLHNYEFENPLEDYCIFVNLKVEVKGRAIRSDYVTDNKTYSLNYYSEQGKESVSFLQGSKYSGKSNAVNGKDVYSLTTNYTNRLYINDLLKRDNNGIVNETNASTEMFGINSIDIQYNNWMVPEVTIKFTDVRGASLFAVEEARHHLTGNNDVNGSIDPTVEGSFFKCFFTFPYPKFTLCVKGFYGQPVAYDLTCSDFRASFNSESGNFEATAKFIGYAFSFLGDVMMNALMAAPFSDYLGKDYWDSKIASNDFTVKDANGQDVPMMTLGEIIANVGSAMEEASGMVQSSPEVQESKNLESQNNQITGITQAYQTFLSTLNSTIDKAVGEHKIESGGFKFTIRDKNGLLAFIPNCEGDTFTDKVSHWYTGWSENDAIKDAYESLANAASGTSFEASVKKLDPTKIKPIAIYTGAKGNDSLAYGDKLNGCEGLKNGVKSNQEISKKLTVNGVTLINREDLHYAYLFVDNNLEGSLKDAKEGVDASIQENQEAISEVTNKAISEALGFSPTIEAMTRIIMAHFETLMYMLTNCARDIVSQKRTLESLGISRNQLADIGRNVSETDLIVPPFPKVTKNYSDNGVDKQEESWVGEYSGQWTEKDIVNGLLNGVNEMAKIISEAKSNDGEGGGSTRAVMKFPLNPLDLILDKKPYGSIDFSDRSSFAGHVIVRMAEILGLADRKFIDAVGAENLGYVEAQNFIEYFKNPPKEFKTWINNTDIITTIEKIGQCDESATPVSQYGKNNKYAWESRKTGPDYRNHLISSSWYLTEFHSKNETFVPIQNASFNKISNDLGTPVNGIYTKLNNVQDYITTKPVSTGGGNSTSGKLICIESNVNRFSTIINNQCTDEKLSKLKEIMLEEALFNLDDYKDFYREDEYVIASSDGSINEEESEEDENATPKELVAETDVDDYYEKFSKSDVFDSGEVNADNYRVLLLPGISDGRHTDKVSVFGQKSYYDRDIYGRAFTFLASLGEYIKYDEVFDKIQDKDNRFINVPYCSLLIIGALCNNFKDPLAENVNFDINKLRNDVRNDLISFFRKWAETDFQKIDSYLSISGDFYNYLRINNKEFNKKFINDNSNNYGAAENNSNGVKLSLNPNSYCALMISRLVLKPYTFVKTSHYYDTVDELVKIGENGEAKAFLNGFISALKENYGTTEEGTDAAVVSQAKDCDTDPDIKLALYRYLKLLYDKWVSGSNFENEFTMKKFFGENPESTSQDDRYFYFIDAYYNRIGNLILVNIGNVVNELINCQNQAENGYTLLSFLSSMYSANKCNFLCVQNFMDLSNEDNMRKMFKPVSMLDMDMPDVTPNFIVMYAYEKSSHLDIQGSGGDYDYPDDSFSIKAKKTGTGAEADKWPMPLNSGEDCGYYIPAFGVSYGKQYQSYFQNVSVSMDSPMVTEQSIKAQFQIASQNNESAKNTEGTATRSMVTMGQDLFTIYSNNSYTCELDMMGDAWVQPLMYFELLNVPMFRGTYLVEKVTHHIEAGQMKTHVVGVRMANTTTKIKKGWYWLSNPTQDGEISEEDMEHQLADVSNDCDYEFFPLGGTASINGMHISVNGVSAMVHNEAGGVGWIKNGGTAKILNGENIPTIGPGLTSNVWPGLREGQKKTGKDILSHYVDALKNEDKVVSGLIKGKKLSQGAIDSMFHAVHWGAAQNYVANCTTSEQVANAWFTMPFNKWKNAERYGSGWAKLCAVWGTIASGQKKITHTTISGFNVSDLKGAQFIVDKYYNPPVELVNALSTTPKAVNDKTTDKNGKNKGIWDDYIYSVQQTAMNTPSCGLNIQTKKETPNSGSIILQNGTGGRDKLAVVFDIILSTYYANIQELWWVAANEHDNGGPMRIDLVLAKKPNGNSIKVGMKINGSNAHFNGVNKNTNEKYRRSIVKFYSKNNRYNPKNPDKCVYGRVVKSKVPAEDWENLKPTACSDLLTGGGTGGVLDANKRIGNWNVGKSCVYANTHARNTNNGYHKGQCAYAVEVAISEGEVSKIKIGGNGHADNLHYDGILKQKGWVIVGQGHSMSDVLPQLQEGDTCVSNAFDGRSPSNAKHGFHFCIYTGTEWVSDYHQGSAFSPYGSKTKNWWIYRYSGSGM